MHLKTTDIHGINQTYHLAVKLADDAARPSEVIRHALRGVRQVRSFQNQFAQPQPVVVRVVVRSMAFEFQRCHRCPPRRPLFEEVSLQAHVGG